LAAAAQRTDVRASLSIGTLDTDVWRLTEPGTPHPRQRVQAVRRLNEAGVPCGVLIAPILPGLSDRDDQLAEVVEACVAAGAESISSVSLHLRPGVREHFLARLATTHPDLAADYDRRYRRAYLPAADRDALTARVRRLVTAAQGRHGGSGRTGHERFPPAPAVSGPARRAGPAAPGSDAAVAAAVPAAAVPAADQLTLDLSATS
jgi:DNA repair photolyase